MATRALRPVKKARDSPASARGTSPARSGLRWARSSARSRCWRRPWSRRRPWCPRRARCAPGGSRACCPARGRGKSRCRRAAPRAARSARPARSEPTSSVGSMLPEITVSAFIPSRLGTAIAAVTPTAAPSASQRQPMPNARPMRSTGRTRAAAPPATEARPMLAESISASLPGRLEAELEPRRAALEVASGGLAGATRARRAGVAPSASCRSARRCGSAARRACRGTHPFYRPPRSHAQGHRGRDSQAASAFARRAGGSHNWSTRARRARRGRPA